MKNWFSRHLTSLILMPCVLLLLFMSNMIYQDLDANRDASAIIDNVTLARYTSDLVHELQKERGMSAGFIGSKGDKFADALKQQRKATDDSWSQLTGFLDTAEFEDQTSATLNHLKQRMQNIQSMRNAVDRLDTSLADMLSYYTGSNRLVLDLNGVLATSTKDQLVSQQLASLYNFAYAKEQAGLERAVLSNAFSNKAFTPALKQKYVSLLTAQRNFLGAARVLADDNFQRELSDLSKSAEQSKVESFRRLADAPSGQLNASPTDWFAAATARINKLKAVEKALHNQISSNAALVERHASLSIALHIGALLLALLVTWAIRTTLSASKRQAKAIHAAVDDVVQRSDLVTEVKIHSQDELGAVAVGLNQLLTKFRDDLQNFQSYALQVSSASQETSVTITQSENNLNNMQSDVSAIASAAEQMSASVREVASIMENGASQVKLAVSESDEGTISVNSAVNGIQEVGAEMQNVASIIAELNDRVANIGGIVDVIQSVAEQTNLLALNAAIEAARAGEQGRGFAVVADEVRNLAHRTQSSTEEISQIVDELQSAAKNACHGIELGIERTDMAVSRAQTISVVLENIVTKMRSIDEVTETVFGSTKEQNTVIQEITSNIARIDTQSMENATGAQQVSSASNDLARIATEMQDQVDAYRVA